MGIFHFHSILNYLELGGCDGFINLKSGFMSFIPKKKSVYSAGFESELGFKSLR
jgi:hypothetical protein